MTDQARRISAEEGVLLDEARNYCRVKLCGNERLAQAWMKLHRAYGALVRKENREAGIGKRAKLRRVV